MKGQPVSEQQPVREQLHLHFHSCSEAETWPEIHLHFHAGPPPRTVRRAGTDLHYLSINPDFPQNGDTVLVHVTSGTTGYICAAGQIVNASGVDDVYAAINQTSPGPACNVGQPISSVGTVTQGTLTPTGTSWHYFFSNIPGASVGSGVTSFLTIYAVRAGIIVDCKQVSFSGQSSTGTDCELHPSLGAARAIRATNPVGSYRVRAGTGGDSPTVGSGLQLTISRHFDLIYRGVSPTGRARIWEPACCQKAGGEWQLLVDDAPGSSDARIVLRSIGGTKLPTPAVWETADWIPRGVNRFLLSTHWNPAAELTELIVDPVG